MIKILLLATVIILAMVTGADAQIYTTSSQRARAWLTMDYAADSRLMRVSCAGSSVTRTGFQ